jgi:hypothetical protein
LGLTWQEPLLQTWLAAQTTPHPPQFKTVVRSVSQPFAGRSSQLSNPVRQALTEQTELTQVAMPFVTGMTLPHSHAPALLTRIPPEEHPGSTADVLWTELSGKVTPPGPTLTAARAPVPESGNTASITRIMGHTMAFNFMIPSFHVLRAVFLLTVAGKGGIIPPFPVAGYPLTGQ